MEEKKWVKVLRVVLAILVFAAIQFLYHWLPRKLGVEWITGWPEFIGEMIRMPVCILIVFLILPRSLRTFKKPKPEGEPAPTKKQKTGKVIVTVLTCVIYFYLFIGQSIWMCFFSRERVDRYIKSPFGKNMAVITARKDNFTARKDDPAWVVEGIYPARTWFFYESDKGVFINPRYSEDVTLTWMGDNTLVVARINTESGEAETETLRW